MPRRAAAPRRAVRLLHQRPSLLRRELHVGARQPHHRASLPAERPPHRLGGTSGPPRGGARHDGEPDGRGGPAPCARRRGHGASVRARPVRRERRRDGGPWNARPRGSLPHGRAHPLLPPGRQPALGHVRMARRRQPPGRRRPARLGRLAHRTLAPPLRRGRLPHHRERGGPAHLLRGRARLFAGAGRLLPRGGSLGAAGPRRGLPGHREPIRIARSQHRLAAQDARLLLHDHGLAHRKRAPPHLAELPR